MTPQKKKIIKIVLIFVPILLLLGGIIGGILFLSQSYNPMEEAIAALESDNEITVSIEKKWIIFEPSNLSNESAFIIYPGGNVEAKAYSVLARGIAKYGFLVVIIQMPFDLAFFSPKRGGKIINNYSYITNWTIIGHSLGGSMAARFVYKSPKTFINLVLLASYPAKSNNLSSYDIHVLSLYGTKDGVLSKNITNTKSLLPETAIIYEIIGGNHANFGYYGKQKGDNDALISREEQHNITISAIMDFC